MGDSGTFGSQREMNRIGAMQQKKKPVNKVANQLTGKYRSATMRGKIGKAAGRMLGY